jgi:alcohol oxidase
MMEPRERDGVVDSHLNVYGVKKLKVADMTICPFRQRLCEHVLD